MNKTIRGVDESSLLAVTILLSAVLFNALLAISNVHFFAVTKTTVIACEVLIVAAAHLVALQHFKSEMMHWYIFAYCLLFVALTRSLILGEFQIRAFRDVFIIPTFVILGMTVSRLYLKRAVFLILWITLASLFIEAFYIDTFSELFDIKNYYIATRSDAYETQHFWNQESTLFVSATRPNDRFLDMFDLHRMSSIMLEPPSLGNLSIIIAAYTCAEYRNLRNVELFQLAFGTLALLVASDSRVGTVTIAIILIVPLLATRFPRYFHAVYLPFALACAFAMVHLLDWAYTGDTFVGRTVFAVNALGRFDLLDVLGISNRSPTFDSGHEYLILNQSIFGLLLFWVVVSFWQTSPNAEKLRYNHCLWIYLSLNLVVSASVFTIKTAAVLWFIYGALQASAGNRLEIRSGERRQEAELLAR